MRKIQKDRKNHTFCSIYVTHKSNLQDEIQISKELTIFCSLVKIYKAENELSSKRLRKFQIDRLFVQFHMAHRPNLQGEI